MFSKFWGSPEWKKIVEKRKRKRVKRKSHSAIYDLITPLKKGNLTLVFSIFWGSPEWKKIVE